MRTPNAEVTEYDVLDSLIKSVPIVQRIVQINPSFEHPLAMNMADTLDQKIGLLHLGVGAHGQFEALIPYLAKGAIVIVEGYTPNGEAYNYAVHQAARGYLSSLAEARHWRGAGVATFLGDTE